MPVAPSDNAEKAESKTTTVIKPGSNIATVTSDDGTSRQITNGCCTNDSKGRTMMPARFVADVLGIGVNYDNQTKTTTFKYDEATVMLTLRAKAMTVNGQAIELPNSTASSGWQNTASAQRHSEAFKGLGLKAAIDWNAETKEMFNRKTVGNNLNKTKIH